MRSESYIYTIFLRLADDAKLLSDHAHRADSYDADAEPFFCEEAVIDIMYFVDTIATRIKNTHAFGYLD